MKPKVICMKHDLFIVFLCFITLCVGAHVSFADEIAYNDILQFAYDNDLSEMQFRSLEDYHIRAVYQMALPEDTQGIHQEILREYSGYEDIYLVEYGFCDIEPIVQSEYFCVGVDAEQNLVKLLTPFEIRARIFDFDAFSDIPITKVF